MLIDRSASGRSKVRRTVHICCLCSIVLRQYVVSLYRLVPMRTYQLPQGVLPSFLEQELTHSLPSRAFLYCLADVRNTITSAGSNKGVIISHKGPPSIFSILSKANSNNPSSIFHTGHGKFGVIRQTGRPTLCHTQT